MSGYSYAHMCRIDHTQIGHNDSSEERCPLCRMRDERDWAIRRLNEYICRKACTPEECGLGEHACIHHGQEEA